MKPDIIEEFNVVVSVGEVSSIRKFKTCLKEEISPVPVLFSDVRIHGGLEHYPTRQTFVDLNDITLNGLKSCFADKAKVSLSKDDGNDFFQATDEGLLLSTRLNVILGERSSGKTFTLGKINSSFENVKYIRQFSLLQNDEEKFKELLTIRQSSVSESFLKQFKEVVADISTVDLKQNGLDLNRYLSSLLKFASESETADSFAKATLFGEVNFTEKNLDSLRELISSVELLLENTEYREMIDEHLNREDLEKLIISLMSKYKELYEINLKKRWLNDLISNIQDELRFRTTTTSIDDVDFPRLLIEKRKADKFSDVVKALKTEKEIDSKIIRGFKIVAYSKKYTGASQLKKKSGRMLSFTEAYGKYDEPYEFLESLRAIDLEQTEYYKYFIDIEYKTLNEDGFPISGGERSEFNLLHEINDALKHNILLIDEPESSFDNIFLKSEVNELIKDIAKEIPVVVVTHNNTVGASIKPNFIVYTQKAIVDGQIVYRVYTGYPHDKKLKTKNNEEIKNYSILLDCLEAGEKAYVERRTSAYEILED